MAFAGLAPLSAQQKRAVKPLITVLNPAVTNKTADRIPLSPRLDTLEGKTIYLVDISWGGPEAATAGFEESNWFGYRTYPAPRSSSKKDGMYTQDDCSGKNAKNAQGALIEFC
jgi:hypothetical protein